MRQSKVHWYIDWNVIALAMGGLAMSNRPLAIDGVPGRDRYRLPFEPYRENQRKYGEKANADVRKRKAGGRITSTRLLAHPLGAATSPQPFSTASIGSIHA